MKNRWKIVWITSGILAAIGLILCILALVLGVSLEKLAYYGVYFEDVGHAIEIENRQIYQTYPTEETSADRFSGIGELYVKVSRCDVALLPTDDTAVRVDTTGLNYGSSGVELVVEQEDDYLEIINYKDGDIWDGKSYLPGVGRSFGCLCIYIPRELCLDEITLECDVYDANLQDLRADFLEIDTGSGDCGMQSVDVGNLEVDIGAGDLEMTGTVRENATLRCGAGDIEMTLNGRYEDYDYDLQCGMGEIQIDGRSYSGLALSDYIGNESPRLIEVSCGAGSVDIEFRPSGAAPLTDGAGTLSSSHHTDDDITDTHHEEDHE